ncbi:MAG: GNAT family N-acetyltransferase [Bacteroidia bacterium]|nr:GNAT family N-acetyltransferase [Bacteroidia bacterium]
MEPINFIDVTAENVEEMGVFCIKNKKAPGYLKKVSWFKNKLNKGLRIILIKDDQGKEIGFIEFIPSELAWRPVKATNFYFIQCIALFGKAMRNQNLGTALLQQCEAEAREEGKFGLCTLSSDGPWMATKEIFVKNGFHVVEKKDRFELMVKAFAKDCQLPKLSDWNAEQQKYKGWSLVYSDQCPWHEKSVIALQESAAMHGIPLKVVRLTSPEEAKRAPSGYGTFTLLRDGKILADHYISKTRFENILKKEIQ